MQTTRRWWSARGCSTGLSRYERGQRTGSAVDTFGPDRRYRSALLDAWERRTLAAAGALLGVGTRCGDGTPWRPPGKRSHAVHGPASPARSDSRPKSRTMDDRGIAIALCRPPVRRPAWGCALLVSAWLLARPHTRPAGRALLAGILIIATAVISWTLCLDGPFHDAPPQLIKNPTEGFVNRAGLKPTLLTDTGIELAWADLVQKVLQHHRVGLTWPLGVASLLVSPLLVRRATRDRPGLAPLLILHRRARHVLSSHRALHPRLLAVLHDHGRRTAVVDGFRGLRVGGAGRVRSCSGCPFCCASVQAWSCGPMPATRSSATCGMARTPFPGVSRPSRPS